MNNRIGYARERARKEHMALVSGILILSLIAFLVKWAVVSAIVYVIWNMLLPLAFDVQVMEIWLAAVIGFILAALFSGKK